MSKDRVSRMCQGLDEHVQAFRTRPLEGSYPYLWLDAKHLKVRDRGRVVSKALVIAYAVHDSGRREVKVAGQVWNGTVAVRAATAPSNPPADGSALPGGRNASGGTSTAAPPPARFTASRAAGVPVNSLFGAFRNETR